jgi:pimeloyl-ACP methyl ester carboxylesterase
MIESLQGRLIFGRTTRIRALAPGPHAGSRVRTTHRLERPGAVLEGWSAHPADGRVDTVVLYFGGRNENVAWAPDMASYNTGAAIHAFNYRGFGGSTGRASERRAKGDAQAIHAFVAARQPMDNLVIIGRSLGTAIALALAREARPARLVLLSPFESVPQVMRARPFGAGIAPLVTQRFACGDLAAACGGETLVLLAEQDASIPHEQSRRLAARFSHPPRVRTIGGTTHQSLPRSPGAQAEIAGFLGAGTPVPAQ